MEASAELREKLARQAESDSLASALGSGCHESFACIGVHMLLQESCSATSNAKHRRSAVCMRLLFYAVRFLSFLFHLRRASFDTIS